MSIFPDYQDDKWLISSFSRTYPLDRASSLLEDTSSIVRNELAVDYVLDWTFYIDNVNDNITTKVFYDRSRCDHGRYKNTTLSGLSEGQLEEIAHVMSQLPPSGKVPEAGAPAWSVQTDASLSLYGGDDISLIVFRGGDVLRRLGLIPSRIFFASNPAGISEVDGQKELTIEWQRP